jgi:hypothetical protein
MGKIIVRTCRCTVRTEACVLCCGKRTHCSNKNYEAALIMHLCELFKTRRITSYSEFSVQQKREVTSCREDARLFRLSSSSRESWHCKFSVFPDMNVMHVVQTVRWMTLPRFPGRKTQATVHVFMCTRICLCLYGYARRSHCMLSFTKRGGKFILRETQLLPLNPSRKRHHSSACATIWTGNNTDLYTDF